MAYENLKNAIKQAIKNNNNQEITGDVLQSTLLSIVNTLGADYKFLGFAVPSTVPPTSEEGNLFYFAIAPGNYSNFKTNTGNLTIAIENGVFFFTKNAADSYWNSNKVFEVAQTTGEAEDKTMSQKVISAELNKKFDRVNIAQTTGEAEDKTMSQKVISAELNKKASVIDVDNSVKKLDHKLNRIYSYNHNNLWNGNVIEGSCVTSTGSYDTSNKDLKRTDFINVEPNQIYFISTTFKAIAEVNNNKAYIAFFNNETFLSCIEGTKAYEYPFFITPAECNRIIINIQVATYNKLISNYEDLVVYKYEDINRISNDEQANLNLLDPLSVPYKSRQSIAIPWNSSDSVIILDYNTKYLKSKQIVSSYKKLEGNILTDVTSPNEANLLEISLNFYQIDDSDVIAYLSRIMVCTKILPLYDYYTGQVKSDTRQFYEYCFGNINLDSYMSNLNKNSFEKINMYTKDTAIDFLVTDKDNINKIYFKKGEGIITNDNNVKGRNFMFLADKYYICKSYPHKQYSINGSVSFEIETDMKLYDFLMDEDFYFLTKIYVSDETYLGQYSKRPVHEIRNLNGEKVTNIEVGNKYIVHCELENKVYSTDIYVDILSENKMIVVNNFIGTYGNTYIEKEWKTGKEIYYNVYLGLNISYKSTKDFYVKISLPKYNMTNLCFPYDAVLNEFEKYIIDINESAKYPYHSYNYNVDDSLSKNPFENAKVVWLGTSVPNEPPYGEAYTKKYPEFVQSLLRFQLTVRSIGGSKMTFNPENNVYGLSMTQEEYETHKNNAGVDRSYENQLKDCWDSDLFVFDHLHNDNGLLSNLKNNPEYWDSDKNTFKITQSNMFDRTWAVGAFNYVIAEIFRYNPRAKIAIINDWRSEQFYNKLANRVVADLWGIPICELRMCNGNVDITTTKDTFLHRYNGGADIKLLAGSSANPLYFQSKSAPDDQSAVADEVKEIQFSKGSDSIHPGRYGRIMYAKHVARWMLNNCILDNDKLDFYY